MEEYLMDALTPWALARKEKLGGHEFVICAISLPFKDFPFDGYDSTTASLRANEVHGSIDKLITEPKFISETEARGMALKYLVEQGCTYLIQADADEIPTKKDIENIIKFISKHEYADWFRLSLKNYVFDKKTYLVEPFQPARIHKVHNCGGYIAAGFHQDNNIYYERPWNKERILDINMSNMTIPQNLVWIKHLSWISDERSRKKCEYQIKRWGKCSFAWDDSKGGLIFNEKYYTDSGKSFPEIAQDS